jgi:hypothetical protein
MFIQIQEGSFMNDRDLDVREQTAGIEKGIEEALEAVFVRASGTVQFIAGGFMNGVVWDQDSKNPLMVKGKTKREVFYSVSHTDPSYQPVA